MIKVTESEQKSILKIFVGFTIISLITFFAITSIYINQNFGQTLLDIVKNSRELELGFIAKNVEQYIENRTQALKDIGSNPLLINSLLRSQGDQASEDFLTHSLILGEKAPITLYDSSGKKIVSSEKQIGTELDQTLLSKIISQEKSYIVNIIGKPDDAIMQISVPILYKSSIKGIIVLESKIDYSRIFGIYNPNHLSFGFQSDERIFHAENFKKIEGDKYQKYIPNLNLVVFFKASEDFYKSKIQKITIDLYVSILISSIISTFILFLLGKNMLLEPYINLSKNKLLLQEKTTALEKSNEELDRFAYIISHDLKEPIRGMSVYAGMLLKKYQDQLDNQGIETLETIIQLGKRSATMLNSILEYSRFGKTEEAYKETDLHEVLKEVIESLGLYIQENKVKILILERLPIIKCDSIRIAEVFKNLITNAIKYNSKEEKIIEISFQKDEKGITHFSVRDNGNGIEEKYFDLIFEIFKRIDDDDGKGTGVGLAIVKKIINSHKGEINVKSEIGKGTCFEFTLTNSQ